MSRNAFPGIEREYAETQALHEHAAMERSATLPDLAPNVADLIAQRDSLLAALTDLVAVTSVTCGTLNDSVETHGTQGGVVGREVGDDVMMPGLLDEHSIAPVPASELEALKRDAARYRWMTTNAIDVSNWPDSAFASREALGAAIDAAMKKATT